MNNEVSATIRAYFAKLGFASEIADIYLALHTNGPQTLSTLSRTSGVERTRLYRLLDELTASNLVEAEVSYKRGLLKAAPIANLHILINQKELEVASLKEELGLIEQVLGRNQLSSPATRVQFYHGPEGIRQMLWNALKATTPLYAYSFHILDEFVGRPFMHRWSEEFTQRGLTEHLIMSDAFVESWQRYSAPDKSGNRRIRGIHYNYIAPDVFPITHSCCVYDDVTTYFSWLDGDVYGIEVYNRGIADTQRLFLRNLLEQTKPETRI